jgi:hypothetical protein
MEASCVVNVSVEIVTYICVIEISTDYPSISRDQSETLKTSQGEKKKFGGFQGTNHSSITEAVALRNSTPLTFCCCP